MSEDMIPELGLPAAIHCRSDYSPSMYGARNPGTAFDPNATTLLDYFSMSIQWMSAQQPVYGLLIYERSDRTPLRGAYSYTKDSPMQPPPRKSIYFFGYLCSRCYKLFLVPQWVHGVNDLDRAMRHGCHGDGSADWFDRRVDNMAREAAAQLIEHAIVSNVIRGDDAHRVHALASIADVTARQLAATVRQETKQVEVEGEAR